MNRATPGSMISYLVKTLLLSGLKLLAVVTAWLLTLTGKLLIGTGEAIQRILIKRS